MQVQPAEVKVREGLERFRKDMGNLEELANSIKKYGQLQPIVVNKDMELLAGGRRLAACMLYKMPVEIRIIDESDTLRMREIEVEENVQREDFTPAEHVLAIKELHDVKQQLSGVGGRMDCDSSWSLRDTAETIGKSVAHVHSAIELATVIEAFPELKKCKSNKELRQAADAITKLFDRATSIEASESSVLKSNRANLRNCSAEELLQSMPDNSVDILLCDPPYGINISEVALGKGGQTGKENNQGFKFADSEMDAFAVIHTIVREAYRVCKDTAHAYMFVAPEFFHTARTAFMEAGWQPYIRPIIWAKVGQGQSNMPDRWPVSSYEMCLYARREKSKLLYTRSDVLTYNRVPPKQKVHPTQKPVELLRDLISRSVMPGSTLIDPCMGSGSSLVAGLQEHLIVYGCDIEKPGYLAAVDFVKSELEKETT